MTKKFKTALLPKERDRLSLVWKIHSGSSLFPDTFRNQPSDTRSSFRFFCPLLLLPLGDDAFRSWVRSNSIYFSLFLFLFEFVFLSKRSFSFSILVALSFPEEPRQVELHFIVLLLPYSQILSITAPLSSSPPPHPTHREDGGKVTLTSGSFCGKNQTSRHVKSALCCIQTGLFCMGAASFWASSGFQTGTTWLLEHPTCLNRLVKAPHVQIF